MPGTKPSTLISIALAAKLIFTKQIVCFLMQWLNFMRLVAMVLITIWGIGKQHSPRCDVAERGVPSGAIMFAQRNFTEKMRKKKKNKKKKKKKLLTPIK